MIDDEDKLEALKNWSESLKADSLQCWVVRYLIQRETASEKLQEVAAIFSKLDENEDGYLT